MFLAEDGRRTISPSAMTWTTWLGAKLWDCENSKKHRSLLFLQKIDIFAKKWQEKFRTLRALSPNQDLLWLKIRRAQGQNYSASCLWPQPSLEPFSSCASWPGSRRWSPTRTPTSTIRFPTRSFRRRENRRLLWSARLKADWVVKDLDLEVEKRNWSAADYFR